MQRWGSSGRGGGVRVDRYLCKRHRDAEGGRSFEHGEFGPPKDGDRHVHNQFLPHSSARASCSYSPSDRPINMDPTTVSVPKRAAQLVASVLFWRVLLVPLGVHLCSTLTTPQLYHRRPGFRCAPLALPTPAGLASLHSLHAGFAALKPVLESSGVYSQLCAPGEARCKEQDTRLNTLFVVASSVNNVRTAETA